MAIEEGKAGASKSQENSSMSNEEVMQELTRLRAEIEAQKKNNQPLAATTHSGVAETSLMKQLVDEITGRKTDEAIQKGQFVSQSVIDPEDILEEAATFFSLKVGYYLMGDMKHGIPVYAPRGGIFFKFKGSRLLPGNNKEKNIMNLSKYKTYSKKERDFLLSHSFFNVFFFNDHEKALNMNTRRAEVMSKLVMQLQYTDGHQLLNMARQQGITITSSPETIRVMLAEKMTDERLKMEEVENRKRASEALKESQLFEGVK